LLCAHIKHTCSCNLNFNLYINLNRQYKAVAIYDEQAIHAGGNVRWGIVLKVCRGNTQREIFRGKCPRVFRDNRALSM